MVMAPHELSLCPSLFIDVGANVGDSLERFFQDPNCYEKCPEHGRSECVPEQPSTGVIANASRCQFCEAQAKFHKCGLESP